MISKNWWKEAKLRWKATSPVFFSKLKKTAVSIVIFAGVLEVAIYYMESKGLFIPSCIKYICTGIVGLGIGGGITANLPVHHSEAHTVDPNHPEQ